MRFTVHSLTWLLRREERVRMRDLAEVEEFSVLLGDMLGKQRIPISSAANAAPEIRGIEPVFHRIVERM